MKHAACWRTVQWADVEASISPDVDQTTSPFVDQGGNPSLSRKAKG